MSLSTRKTVILAKIETNYGEDANPAADADGLLVSEVELEPIGEVLERDIYQDTYSKEPHKIGAKEYNLSFKFELKGSGSLGVAPKVGKLFQACGMSENIIPDTSVTYGPESDDASVKSLTIYVFRDKILHKLTGCRGDWDADLQAAKYGYATFKFKGLYLAAIDQDAPALSNLEATLPQVIKEANFTWGSFSPVASKLGITYGNNVARREDFNAEEGVGAFRISDRKPVGSFNPEAVLEATHPFWADWAASVARALSIQIGASAGNIVTIQAPKCVQTNLKYEDEEGVLAYGLQFALTKNTTGDDEISVVFT